MLKRRYLVLEDGTVFKGFALGSDKLNDGEIVFNTGMTGYQETISDPSYTGQIVTFTYPLIGNYGINRDDYETLKPSISGIVVREACQYPSNFRTTQTLHDMMKFFDIPGISGIDTRKLTKKIRSQGVLKAGFVNQESEVSAYIDKLKQLNLKTNEVEIVSTERPYISTGDGYKVVLLDFGKKENIIRELNRRGCEVIVMPSKTPFEEIKQIAPDGVMVSNGPGNPESVSYALNTIKQIIGTIPFFGICLGHQLFGLSQGATTYKMKFGHRGSNHPVKNLKTNKVDLTSQNHGYSIDPDSLKHTDLEVTHIALNDNSIEGIKHKKHLAFSVQYHPEASPGPHDSNYLFDEFVEMISLNKQKESQYNV